MKVTRMELEGPNGEVALRIVAGDLVVTGRVLVGWVPRRGPGYRGMALAVESQAVPKYETVGRLFPVAKSGEFVRVAEENVRDIAARQVWEILEGVQGTQGDVYGVRCMIDQLAD